MHLHKRLLAAGAAVPSSEEEIIIETTTHPPTALVELPPLEACPKWVKYSIFQTQGNSNLGRLVQVGCIKLAGQSNLCKRTEVLLIQEAHDSIAVHPPLRQCSALQNPRDPDPKTSEVDNKSSTLSAA